MATHCAHSVNDSPIFMLTTYHSDTPCPIRKGKVNWLARDPVVGGDCNRIGWTDGYMRNCNDDPRNVSRWCLLCPYMDRFAGWKHGLCDDDREGNRLNASVMQKRRGGLLLSRGPTVCSPTDGRSSLTMVHSVPSIIIVTYLRFQLMDTDQQTDIVVMWCNSAEECSCYLHVTSTVHFLWTPLHCYDGNTNAAATAAFINGQSG